MGILSDGVYDDRIIQWWQQGLSVKEIAQRLPQGVTPESVNHRRKLIGLYENRNASPAQRAKEAQKYIAARDARNKLRNRSRG